MVPYNDVFEKSDINATCSYNKDKGTISISKYGKTISMTIGSKSAKVNGKAVTLPVAPVKIKYVDTGEIKVLVPSRYVSETLGLGYTWYSSKNTVAIVKKTMQLSYNSGKEFEYTGVQGAVTIDSKSVSLTDMPSIITNNTAMLRAKRVFADSVINAGYQYDKSTKAITLTKGDVKLVMTVGSKTAYLNGKSLTMDTAPMVVKNYANNVSYVMVPGGFTASCLGYDYTWNNSKRTSMITSRKEETTSNSPDAGSAPELGDTGVIIPRGTILVNYLAQDHLYGKSSGQYQFSQSSGSTKDDGMILSVYRDYGNIKPNLETFAIISNSAFGKVTSKLSDKKITLQISNMGSVDQTYPMYGITSNYVNIIKTSNKADTKSSVIEVELLQEDTTYDISLSPDKQTLYITVYANSLTSATIGTNDTGDYITLTGIKPLRASITVNYGLMYLDLPGTTNAVGDVISEVSNSKFIKRFYVLSSINKTQVILELAEGYDYFTSDNENQFSIQFQSKETDITQPQTPQTPQIPQTPQTPVEVDKNNCEIIIPLPEGVTGNMITDEDDYFNNRFKIKFAGDYTSFYNNQTITKNSSIISKITVTLNSKNETEIVIYTTKLQGYQYSFDNSKVYVNIGDPKEIYKNIVVLDPGHGGPANGAQYFGSKEKDVNFSILYTIGKKYFNSDSSKLKVYYTRVGDVDMGLSDRAAFTQRVGADLFVSLHMNASLASSAAGTEVFYSNSNNKANSAGLTSKTLASIFVNNLSNTLGTTNRGVKQEMYTVVHKNTVPAVLIELGFLSNKAEHARLTDASFQENAAIEIYETILEVFQTYPTGR